MSLSQEELKIIIESSPTLIWKSDVHKSVYYFNKAWLKFRGRTLDEEKDEGWMKGIHPDDLEECVKTYHEKFDQRTPFDIQYRLKRHDGEYRLIKDKGIPYFDKKNVFKGFVGYCMDITDQKTAEGKLKEERKRLSGILEGTNSGTWEWNVQTGETVFNERWANIIGYTLSELAPVIIETWVELCHPDDLQKSNKVFDKLFNHEIDYYECEVRMRHKNGDWVWILDRGKVTTWTEDGKPLLVMGTHQDITDKKKAEEELLKERERLNGILEGTNSGTWEWNIQTGETVINERWAEIIGYTLEELMPVSQETWNNHCHPEDREKSDRLFEDHCKGKSENYECETRMRHKSGKWIWVLDRGKVITRTDDGEPLFAMGTHQDITERKEAEKKLANSEVKYRELIDNTTDIIYTINTDGEFTFVSNAWKRELGHERHEVLGKSFTKFLHPEDVESSYSKLRDIYYSGETIKALEYRIRHKDGSWRWHRSSGSFKKDATEKVTLFDGLSHDITQQKVDQAEIAKQSALQKIMIQLASSFINIPLKNVDEAINKALALTGKHFKVDRSYIFDYEWENNTCRNTYEWCADGITPEIENLQELPLELLPHWVKTHRQGKKMLVKDVSKLDDEDQEGLKEVLEPQGIKSLITLPLMIENKCIGFVGFDSVKDYRTYTKSEEDLLIVFAEMLVNITKRKIADQELVKQKEKVEQNAKELKEAQKVARLANWYLDIETNKVIWSETLYDMYGFDSSQPPPDYSVQEKIFTKDSWKSLTEAVTDATKGIPYELELNFIRADGTLGWMWAKGEPVKNQSNEITGLRGIAQDITKRKELELELKESNAQNEIAAKRLQVATSSAGLGIFDWDIIENKLIWDDRMYEMHGLSKEDTTLSFESWSSCVHPDDLSKAIEDVNDALVGNQEFNTFFRVVHPNGDEKYIKGYAHVMRNENNQATKMIGVNLDITESQIHQKSLEFKNKQLIDFSNILAHNLRAPLVNIGMLVDLIEENEDPEETKEYTGQLKSVLDHLNEVFNELMESIQIKQDLDVESVEIDLNERIDKTLKGLKSQILKYDAKIHIDITSASSIRYPSKYIDSILSNLISNALKYHSPERKPEITIKTKKVNRDVILSIEDNGLGLDMNLARKNLFKIRKVFHEHPDAKGFGLFLIKSQIDAMEGEIWVESALDKGSTFFVKFKNAVI
jgi:PAS domain S-box-containing protein